MRALILVLIGVFCLAINLPTQASAEPTIAYVQRIHLFKNSDEGAFFYLSDGSQWERTWWYRPIFYLRVGQEVVLIPMTEEEAAAHPHFYPTTPHWIMFHNAQGEVEMGVVFKMK